MVLPVRMRIHWGSGRFCFCFFPKIFFTLKVLLDGCGGENVSVSPSSSRRLAAKTFVLLRGLAFDANILREYGV